MERKTYAELSRGKPPSSLVLKAIPYVAEKGMALDLGAGSLRNSRPLLAEGFRVRAIDKDPIAQEVAVDINSPELEVQITTFSDFEFPSATYDLIVAINTLPFATPEEFPKLWERLVTSLKPGGILAGTFFGPNDTWAEKSTMTFLSKEQVEELLAEFEILELNELEKDAQDIQGNPKHWHIFEVIARKKPESL